MNSSPFRPLRLVVFGFVLTLVLSLAVIGVLNWRGVRRLDEIRRHARRLGQLQSLELQIERAETVAESGRDASGVSGQRILEEVLDQMTRLGGHIAPNTPQKLAQVRELIEIKPPVPESFAAARRLLGEATTTEALEQQRIVDRVQADTRSELRLVVIAPILLTGLAGGILFLSRRRIVDPLQDLGKLVSRLAEGQLEPVTTERLDPLVKPLFDNYNRLVIRLSELEIEHRSRAADLEAEVRVATSALLLQQRSLARAERLAAAGVMAASLAHELRNPLAGIDMALRNLRRDAESPERAERLELVLGELRRMQGLLNGLLDRARVPPEPARTLGLDDLVHQLLALVKYQVPAHVRLVNEVSPDLRCSLPENPLRQALLNLVLNAAQALGDRPGAIAVSAESREGQLWIRVVDDGPGYSSELLRQVARPFLSTRRGGTGLGLVMVRRFVEEAGGRLELSNVDPHGACATMVFPCRGDHE